ncbi:MAG: acylphosphatase [Stappiaceae bacterium]
MSVTKSVVNMSTRQSAHILLTGDLVRETLPDWVEHRALKLGLSGWVKWNTIGQLEIMVSGPEDLVDALEIACSLGPFDSQIKETLRKEVGNHSPSRVNSIFQNLCSDA